MKERLHNEEGVYFTSYKYYLIGIFRPDYKRETLLLAMQSVNPFWLAV